MLLHLVRKELLDQLLSLRFAIACVLCLVVFLLSSLMLARDFRAAVSTYNMNSVLHRNEILQVTEIWGLGEVTVDRPPNAMNVVVRGINPDLTESVAVGRGRLDFADTYEQNPLVPLFPAVDFVFIVGTIMSLLALAFSYDAVSGERESGVLKVVASYSVPRDLLLRSKWIGGYLALIAPFIAAFLVGLVVMLIYPEIERRAEDALALAALLLLALLYLAAIYSLGILVSCRTQIPSTSITVLLLVWVALVLVVPNLAPHIANRVLPVPSRDSLQREKAAIQEDAKLKYAEMLRLAKERTGSERPWEDEEFQNDMNSVRQEVEAQIQKVNDGYIARMQAQTHWSGIVARLSPLTSFTLAALDLGSAGLAQEARFVDAVKVHAGTWADYVAEKSAPLDELRNRSRSGEHVSREDWQRLGKGDFSDYPRFEFEPMAIANRLSSVYVDVLLLAVWGVVFFMAAHLSFLRYDVQ
jgi:ABC-type transport system involved in multi-copper enzyme maturation permease subunit